jgi:hypothetical protein
MTSRIDMMQRAQTRNTGRTRSTNERWDEGVAPCRGVVAAMDEGAEDAEDGDGGLGAAGRMTGPEKKKRDRRNWGQQVDE